MPDSHVKPDMLAHGNLTKQNAGGRGMQAAAQAMAVFALMTAVRIIAGSGARNTARKVKNPNRFRYAAWGIAVAGVVAYLASEVSSIRHSWLGVAGAVFVLCASTYDVVNWRRTRR